ncbi:MAG: orotate phosphoribosyltransferase [Alphaproteobacteria bacterium]
MGTVADDRGARTARILLDIKAVNFKPDDPFTLTSGRLSPTYIDCRKIISYPAARRDVTAMAAALVREKIGATNLDVIAGGETAGIPFAAWIADALDLPMVYVRKKPKGFGRMAQIEGDLAEGARVLLVEDLATDGGSKIHFVKALRAAGAAVTHTFVVFHYGVFPESIGGLREIGVDLLALATWRDVIAEARRGGDFPETDLAKVEEFLADPVGWQDARQ